MMAGVDTGEAATCIAVVGAGSIGRRHLEVATQLLGACAVAIPARPESFGELQRLGFATASSLRELVGKARLVIVATETSRHLADGLQALDLGFDVLMEKPLACDASEGRRLVDAARASARTLLVGYNLRFCDSLLRFRQRLHELGAIHSVHVECRSYLPDWRTGRDYRSMYSARAREGGVLLDLSHEIDYTGWLFGWPAALSALLVNTGRLGIAEEEAAHLRWITEPGTVVTLELDYLSRPSRRVMRAAGEKGTLEWSGTDGSVTFSGADGKVEHHQSPQTRNEMMAKQLEACLSGWAEHATTPATALDALRTLAVIDAARRSAASQVEVEQVTV